MVLGESISKQDFNEIRIESRNIEELDIRNKNQHIEW